MPAKEKALAKVRKTIARARTPARAKVSSRPRPRTSVRKRADIPNRSNRVQRSALALPARSCGPQRLLALRMNRSEFPFLGFGVGLRRPHYGHVIDAHSSVD